MELLKELNYQGKEVRILEIEDKPYFVGKDVAEILDYAKARNAIAKHVDDEDKKDAPIQGTLGGTQQMTIINESGLYSLIFSSKLESARRFKRWITSEVLPDIRKYGMYINDDFAKAIIDNPKEAREEMSKYFNESQRLKEVVKSLQEENSRLKQAEVDLIEVEKKLEFLQDRPENTDWKTEANKRVRQLTPKITGFVKQNFGQAWNEVYREMLYSENINIKAKHTRRLKKMEMDNVSKSTIDNTKIIDTIGTDIEYVDKMFNAISNLEEKYTFNKNETSQEVPCCFGDELLDF